MAKDTSKTLRAALTATAPVFFGYIFVGMAFGLLLQKAGYNALWAFGCSLTVYAGSMQFVLVELLTSWVGLAQTADVTLAEDNPVSMLTNFLNNGLKTGGYKFRHHD